MHVKAEGIELELGHMCPCIVAIGLIQLWLMLLETIECPKDVSIGEDAKLGVEHRVNVCKDG
jgi:hypothetical protein